VRFEAFALLLVSISIVWDMVLCILIHSYQPRTLTNQTALKVEAASSSEMLVSVKYPRIMKYSLHQSVLQFSKYQIITKLQKIDR